ncbi:hypothetical protein ACRAWF_24685 [Streptomyces sp. L7]
MDGEPDEADAGALPVPSADGVAESSESPMTTLGRTEPESQRTGWLPRTKGAPSTRVSTVTGKMASSGSRERM